MDHKLMLANLLGVAATATDADFEAAVALANQRMRDGKELQNRTSLIALAVGLDKDSDTTAIANRATELVTESTALKNSHKDLLGEQIERDLIEFADVIADKEGIKANLLRNRGETIKFLKALKKPARSTQPLHNRSQATPPKDSVEDQTAASEQDRVRAAKIKNRADEIMRNRSPRCSFNAAWEQAKAETERNELVNR